MTEMQLDYEAIGFRAGLEVHHQLQTAQKLFCHCPAELTNREHDVEILRHMRPTLSELGEYDGTALMEFKTRKTVIYRIYRDLNCTYEMDDTPPFLVNREALKFSSEIALMFGMNLVDELHVSRKQYLDGSIPTGFQRTAIIGVGGGFPLGDRMINISHLSMEEDACREVSDIGHVITFKNDRLGIPLIEVVTKPDFRTPREIGAGAAQIRRLLTCSGRIRRGSGSGRQDVNVSIRGGTRIEIKGVSKIPAIPKLVENEALRQYTLLKIRDELRARGVTYNTIEPSRTNVTRMLFQSDNEHLQKAIAASKQVEAVRLRGFGGLFSIPTQNGAVFGEEFSGRVRVIACIDAIPNLLFPESPEAMGISDGIWRRIRKRLKATHHDEVVLVWGNREDLETAVSEIYIRAREATEGVPSETRQARKDGTNDFERILPGPNRMYPDTDHPPVPIDPDWAQHLQMNIPDTPWNREARYRSWNVPECFVKALAVSPYATIFESVATAFPDSTQMAAEVFANLIKHLERTGYPVDSFQEYRWLQFFEAFAKKRFFREAALFILQKWSRTPKQSLNTILKQLNLVPVTLKNARSAIQKSIDEASVRSFPTDAARSRYLMGAIMTSLRGKVEGSRVASIIEDMYKN
ncbi:Glu-tRNA(Gln) amidotransferase subunit GatE [bacterium]|nr:Glu-tRNA(Gln) amidotransferase subunit GatE [candidate division CSSED10-310 bacterium]